MGCVANFKDGTKMILRKHQKEMSDVCDEILAGAPINEIIADVTPGGGKSALPVILSNKLIPAIATKIIWVVPRNSLKYQGESEYIEPCWNTPQRIRAAINEEDPTRGLEGYVTTYQAIGQNPLVHLHEFEKHDYILFLDEPHHVSEGSSWENALEPLIKMAKLVVKASGTLSRKDGKKIAFMDYSGQFVDLTDTVTRRIISYSRADAIREGAICPLKFKLFDGKAEWLDSEFDEVKHEGNISDRENFAKAVFAALHTEYAYQLMGEAIKDWQENLEIKQDSKLLVVAPNIKLAKKYQDWLYTKGFNSRIATSEDSPEAKQNIDDYKKGSFNILVTVAMAYEGLSVKEITHVACLTLIRSVPWLEQCFARANRLSPNKTCGMIYAPKDFRFLSAITMINHSQLLPIQLQRELELKKKEAFEGEAKPWIIPIGSQAAGVDHETELKAVERHISPSQQEKILKQEIRKIRKLLSNSKRPGATKAALNVFDARIKLLHNKKIDDMNKEELESAWVFAREKYLK